MASGSCQLVSYISACSHGPASSHNMRLYYGCSRVHTMDVNVQDIQSQQRKPSLNQALDDILHIAAVRANPHPQPLLCTTINYRTDFHPTSALDQEKPTIGLRARQRNDSRAHRINAILRKAPSRGGRFQHHAAKAGRPSRHGTNFDPIA